MATVLSSFWEKFIAEYAADDVYWYFPKGGTVDTIEVWDATDDVAIGCDDAEDRIVRRGAVGQLP